MNFFNLFITKNPNLKNKFFFCLGGGGGRARVNELFFTKNLNLK